uniref:Uncharacterized protein n=1 Tax=Myoviridae sp. ctisV53 TaxID=2825156 RepID=A0A8S5PND8_9CAUD|nr:MAG TPA: hypothetical protein [Myoviridae sp. ctisV53]DAE49482.1 MAG TPA: hypothetical protein [Bacteriophage sp.]
MKSDAPRGAVRALRDVVLRCFFVCIAGVACW